MLENEHLADAEFKDRRMEGGKKSEGWSWIFFAQVQIVHIHNVFLFDGLFTAIHLQRGIIIYNPPFHSHIVTFYPEATVLHPKVIGRGTRSRWC